LSLDLLYGRNERREIVRLRHEGEHIARRHVDQPGSLVLGHRRLLTPFCEEATVAGRRRCSSSIGSVAGLPRFVAGFAAVTRGHGAHFGTIAVLIAGGTALALAEGR